MSQFQLQRIESPVAPVQWLLWYPGCRVSPLVIPDGNMAELVRQFVAQGGEVEEIAPSVETGAFSPPGG
jgi:hypothetical protein